MHLNRLFIRNFKKYKRAEIAFQDGLTGIIGGNGAGKSTIVEAIAWALYGRKASAIKNDFIKNAGAGENEPVEVVLDLGMGKHELTISRGMRGKNLAPEAALLLDNRPVASGSREVDQRLEEMLKISYQDFMKTFYARQKDLDNLLKEGGTGKREYLLKLLGMDDIRERSMEQIKSDIRSSADQKNRISGALTEIGEVEKKIEESAMSISTSKDDLILSREKEARLTNATEKRRQELDFQVEKRRSHDLLAERISRREASVQEKQKIIRDDEDRLKEIDGSKILLDELEPKLKRLKIVKARIELLEPRRKEYDKLLQKSIRIGTELIGLRRTFQDFEQRLVSLKKDSLALDEIRPLEFEYQDHQVAFSKLEALRDEHIDLQTRLKEETIRLDSTKLNLSRVIEAIMQLLEAKNRQEELHPLLDEHERLQIELADLSNQKDLSREHEGLISRKMALMARSQKLAILITETQRDLAALGDLDAVDVKLRTQDADLDNLRTDLVNQRENLRGDLKVQEANRDEAKQNLSRAIDLGEGGFCPTCERPLGDQYIQLVDKYGKVLSSSEQLIEDLKRKIKEQTDKINGVIASRSSLKKAFDDLNSRKSRRAELFADLRGVDNQAIEVASESEEIAKAIAALGPVRYDPERLMAIQARQEQLLSSVKEYRSLTFKIEDLPRKEAERETLEKDCQNSSQKIKDLNRNMKELGYIETEYSNKKRRLSMLKPIHDRFVLLSQSCKEIPELESRVTSQKADLAKLIETSNVLEKALTDLGFDPTEYESLVEERKSLSEAEENAQRIKLNISAEQDIRQRLEDAALSLADQEFCLLQEKEELKALGYSDAQHSAAHKALEEAKRDQEAARKDASDKQVNLGVLESEMARLQKDAHKKKDYEQELIRIGRRMEVLDATRSLINRFMDHILVRIRSEIVRIAGDILEEVSGKYSLLKIDEDFNIQVEDGGEFYPISRYSGGEVDMIAVSVRVAISEYLMRFCRDGPGYSFLILDEIFGSQDIEHREKMISMLRGLEERFPQIIAISHFSDVQGQFDNTINVIEDEIGNSRIEVI